VASADEPPQGSPSKGECCSQPSATYAGSTFDVGHSCGRPWQSGRAPLSFYRHQRGWLHMDENRGREVSASPPVSGRDAGRFEPAGDEGRTSASEEDFLRRKARAAIHAGMLPGRNHVSVWGGPGSGGSCAVCGSTVPGDGLGFELEFRDAMGRLELRYVHIPCFAAWDLECRSLLQADGNTCTISDRERVER